VGPQVVAAVEEEHGTVAPVELDEVVAADDMARVVGNRDDEVEDDVLGEQVEEVFAIKESGQALLDNPKEWIQRTEVVEVVNHGRLPANVGSKSFWVEPSSVHSLKLVAVRQTKSAKLTGDAPVTPSPPPR
jgi:hypothetical protein